MHTPLNVSLPLPLHIVGDVRHFHAFVDTFSYLPILSELLLVDYVVIFTPLFSRDPFPLQQRFLTAYNKRRRDVF